MNPDIHPVSYQTIKTKNTHNPGTHEGQAVPASYKTPAMLLIVNMCWTPQYANKHK